MAVTTSDITIAGISAEQETNPFGAIVDIARVLYNIGDFGPYSVVIPKLEMTAQRVLQDVRQDAQKYIDVLNLTF